MFVDFELEDGSIYDGIPPLLYGNTIDADTFNEIDHYRENTLVQWAIYNLDVIMLEAKLVDRHKNYLKKAELAVKDECSMISGSTNNGNKVETVLKPEESFLCWKS